MPFESLAASQLTSQEVLDDVTKHSLPLKSEKWKQKAKQNQSEQRGMLYKKDKRVKTHCWVGFRFCDFFDIQPRRGVAMSLAKWQHRKYFFVCLRNDRKKKILRIRSLPMNYKSYKAHNWVINNKIIIDGNSRNQIKPRKSAIWFPSTQFLSSTYDRTLFITISVHWPTLLRRVSSTLFFNLTAVIPCHFATTDQ